MKRRSPTENIDKSKLPKLVVNMTPGARFVIQDDDEDDEVNEDGLQEAANGPVNSVTEVMEEFKAYAEDRFDLPKDAALKRD